LQYKVKNRNPVLAHTPHRFLNPKKANFIFFENTCNKKRLFFGTVKFPHEKTSNSSFFQCFVSIAGRTEFRVNHAFSFFMILGWVPFHLYRNQCDEGGYFLLSLVLHEGWLPCIRQFHTGFQSTNLKSSHSYSFALPSQTFERVRTNSEPPSSALQTDKHLTNILHTHTFIQKR